jgi:hypothetical protein
MDAMKNPFASLHRDVLDATPSDQDGKDKLLEELRSRAKGAISSKQYPAADLLYTKAIEVLSDDATLYGNRSMVRLTLGQFKESLEDAEKCISLDENYAKGFYRKGQALNKLKKYTEAAEAYDLGLKLEPDNKTFKSLGDKARQAAEDQANEPPPLEVKSAIKMPVVRPKGFVDTKTDKEASTSGSGGGGGDKKANELRGYKITADGRKTTFFNNDLDDEAKALIGDIRPKKLDESAESSDDKPALPAGSSVWNTAGTWEEKSMTPWGKEKMEELLVGVEFELPNDLGTLKTTKMKDLTGDCSITMIRKKKKYLFDWSFKLDWSVKLKDIGPCTGSLTFPDVTPDSEGEYDAQMEVNSSTPPAARAILDQFVRNSAQGLRPSIEKQISVFIEEFNKFE